jgi:hypothetical protein
MPSPDLLLFVVKLFHLTIFCKGLFLLSMAAIAPDEEVFSQFTEKSKQQYRRIWAQFRDFVVVESSNSTTATPVARDGLPRAVARPALHPKLPKPVVTNGVSKSTTVGRENKR